MSATLSKLMTADEFWNCPLNAKGVELVRGEVEPALPTSVDHGAIVINIGMLLKLWSRQTEGGWVGTETGFLVVHDPDTVRGPDVAFVAKNRIPETGHPYPYWSIHPDLAVEVVSPSDTAQRIHTKVAEYLGAGTPEVWVVYPGSRQVVVHTPDGVARTYGEQSQLTSQVLSGFSCTVADLFAI